VFDCYILTIPVQNLFGSGKVRGRDDAELVYWDMLPAGRSNAPSSAGPSNQTNLAEG